MSDLEARQNGDASGSLGAGSPEPAMIDSPLIAPDHEAPKADAMVGSSNLDASKVDPTEVDPSKADIADAAKGEQPKAEMPKATPFNVDGIKADIAEIEAKIDTLRAPRELLVVSPQARDWERGEQSWESRTAKPEREAEAPPKAPAPRRFAAMAAMLVVAVIAGAAGGALATIGVTRFGHTAAGSAPDAALQASVARIDADIASLKAGLEQTSKTSLSQLNRTNDRLERIEKAQAEPAAKLAKLSEAVDRLRAAPAAGQAVASATPAAAREVTGSLTAPPGAHPLPTPQAAAAPPKSEVKSEVGRLPTVEGWVLREVGHGGALVEGRGGLYEVYAGDPLPGLGRVDAIRRQDGRWVVVTSRGLIVAR